MPSPEQEKAEYSDEELEEIIGMQAPHDLVSVKELRDAVRENPLLMSGLALVFGILVGVALSPNRRRPR